MKRRIPSVQASLPVAAPNLRSLRRLAIAASLLWTLASCAQPPVDVEFPDMAATEAYPSLQPIEDLVAEADAVPTAPGAGPAP